MREDEGVFPVPNNTLRVSLRLHSIVSRSTLIKKYVPSNVQTTLDSSTFGQIIMATSRIAVAFLHRHGAASAGAMMSSASSALSSTTMSISPVGNARTAFTVAAHRPPRSHQQHRRQDQSPPPRNTTASSSSDFRAASLIRAPFLTYHAEKYRIRDRDNPGGGAPPSPSPPPRPGSIAFGECEIAALSDLFLQFAKKTREGDDRGPYLNLGRVRLLLESVGERPDDDTLASLLADVDAHGDGRLRLDCFLRAADRLLGEAPARIVLVVGGPGSGKGELCGRLAATCGAVHLRSVVVVLFCLRFEIYSFFLVFFATSCHSPLSSC